MQPSRRTGLAPGRSVAHVELPTAAAFLLPLVLYLATIAPTIYNLDSAELTTAAYTGGLMRATGYPLYLLIGRAWSRIPIGDVGLRMNLLSAVCGALTIALTQRILRRLGVVGWAAFAALGLLATAQYFWAMSLIAEVYTLHTALMAAIILTLLRWREKPVAERLGVCTLLVALSFGNHVATVLLVPGCVVFVLITQPREALRPRSLLWAAGGILMGLSVYLYLPLTYLSQPQFNYAGAYDALGRFHAVDLTTMKGLWWLVSGRAFANAIMAYSPAELMGELAHFGSELVRAFMVIGVGPGLLGAVIQARRQPRRFVLLALLFTFSAGFYINYRVVDKDTMFLPAYLVWAVWAAVGFQWLLEWVGPARSSREPSDTTSRLAASLRALYAAGVGLAVLWTGPLVDLSSDASARLRGERILERVEVGGLVIGWWGTVPVVEYLQMVEGLRPDVDTMNRFLIDQGDLRSLISREIERRAVYLDGPPGDGLPGFASERFGPVFRLHKISEESEPGEAESDSGAGHRREPGASRTDERS